MFEFQQRSLASEAFRYEQWQFANARLNQDPPAADNHNLLWYDNPAVKWVEALPVGNGRLSAMIFGQPANERLLLNDGTLGPVGLTIR